MSNYLGTLSHNNDAPAGEGRGIICGPWSPAYLLMDSLSQFPSSFDY